jgi:hypothetical protein
MGGACGMYGGKEKHNKGFCIIPGGQTPLDRLGLWQVNCNMDFKK